MKKKLLLSVLFALFAFCNSNTLCAETQAIKVGGRLANTFLTSSKMNLRKGDMATEQSNFFTQATVCVDADLTDNIAVSVSLVGERDWDSEADIPMRILKPMAMIDDMDVSLNPAGVANTFSNGLTPRIATAYCKMSEFYSSPLSLTIGRQPLYWGSGLILADGTPNQLAIYLEPAFKVNTSLSMKNPFYSIRNSFDAVKCEYDLDTIKLEGIFAVTSSNTYMMSGQEMFMTDGDSGCLLGFLCDYMVSDQIRASFSLLHTSEDRSNFIKEVVLTTVERAITTPAVVGSGTVANPQTPAVREGDEEKTVRMLNPKKAVAADPDQETDEVSYNTLSLRCEGTLDSIDPNLQFEVELACQFGDDIRLTGANAFKADREGKAAILGVTYSFVEHLFKPKVSLYYDYRSGDKKSDDNKLKAWTATYYGRTIGHLIDQISNYSAFLETYVIEAGSADSTDVSDPASYMRKSYFPSSSSNIHAITASTSFSPAESLDVFLSLVFASLDQELNKGYGKSIGVEFIANADYAFSDSTRFVLQGSYFDAGKGVSIPKTELGDHDADTTTAEQYVDMKIKPEAAYELIGSVVVDF